jgi:hypothetical protein
MERLLLRHHHWADIPTGRPSQHGLACHHRTLADCNLHTQSTTALKRKDASYIETVMLQALKDAGFQPAKPLEVIMFTTEEASRFSVPCLGRCYLLSPLLPSGSHTLVTGL